MMAGAARKPLFRSRTDRSINEIEGRLALRRAATQQQSGAVRRSLRVALGSPLTLLFAFGAGLVAAGIRRPGVVVSTAAGQTLAAAPRRSALVDGLALAGAVISLASAIHSESAAARRDNATPPRV